MKCQYNYAILVSCVILFTVTFIYDTTDGCERVRVCLYREYGFGSVSPRFGPRCVDESQVRFPSLRNRHRTRDVPIHGVLLRVGMS